jgi:hypothetical protein
VLQVVSVLKERSVERRRRLAVYLVTAITAGWMLFMISFQFWQASEHGYGSGFGDGGHVPSEIVEEADVGSDRDAVVDELNSPGAEGGVWGETWRLLLSILILIGIIYVWYLVMSGLGTF